MRPGLTPVHAALTSGETEQLCRLHVAPLPWSRLRHCILIGTVAREHAPRGPRQRTLRARENTPLVRNAPCIDSTAGSARGKEPVISGQARATLFSEDSSTYSGAKTSSLALVAEGYICTLMLQR